LSASDYIGKKMAFLPAAIVLDDLRTIIAADLALIAPILGTLAAIG